MTIKEAIHTLYHGNSEKDEEKAKQARSMGIDALYESEFIPVHHRLVYVAVRL